MKKSRIILIIVVILVILALVLGGVYRMLQRDAEAAAVAEAEDAQSAAYAQYAALMEHVGTASVTVTEQGKTIGVYSLEQLGLQAQILADAEKCFGELDQMEPADFAALTPEEKIAWQAEARRQEPVVQPDMSLVDVSGIMLDLDKVIRIPAQSAYPYFDGGAYAIKPETPGTQLERDKVEQALLQAIAGLSVSDQTSMELVFEVTDCGPYRAAAVTAENGVFNYAALLERDSAGITIPVTLLGQTRTLDVASVVTADEDGVVHADRAALEQLAAQWAGECRAVDTPYILDSYVEGPIELDFLEVTYELNQAALVDLLAEQVVMLDGTPVEAPFYCTREGQPFALEGTFVEVDVDNQQMTFYKDGEVVVNTDVVTGYPWGHWTPPGLYAVQNKDTDCWLYGEDYTVFVKYWVGFHGAYGLHDASWRTIFGGKKYLSDGSHGCVNTPEEAMAQIFAEIEVGVPVVVHDEREPDD